MLLDRKLFNLSLNLILWVLTFCCLLSQLYAEQRIHVAVNLPMTGKIGIYGQQIQKGLLFAAEERNYKNSRGYKFMFDWQDNKSELKEANTIYMQQKSTSPSLFITGLKPQFEVLKKALSKSGKPNFAWVWDPVMNGGTSGNHFQTWNNFRAESDCMLEHIEELGGKKIVYIYVQLPSTDYVVNNLMRPRLKAKGIEILSIPYSYDEVDFRTLVLRIKNAAPDLIIWNGFVNQIATLVKEGKNQNLINLKNNIFSMDLLDATRLLSEQQMEDLVVCVPEYLQALRSKKVQSWYEKYEKRFKEQPSYHAMYAYDQFQLILAASEDVEQVADGKQWIDALYKISTKGIVSRLHFDSTGSLPIKLTRMRYQNKELVPLEGNESHIR